MTEQLLEKPIMMMTGSEFLELLKIAANQQTATITQDFTDKKYVYGINGLANLLNCGKTKAQEIKNSGIIDEALYQTGKKIVFDGDKVLQLLKK